jgi:cyclopropane-fatty-acyl-phospholipid synthase
MSETIVPRASPTPASSQKTARSTIDRAAAALAGRLASRLSYGTLVVRDTAGSVRYGTGRADQPMAEVTVANGHAFSSVLRRGSVGLGQSYVDGWWECDDLTALVRILLRNLEGLGRLADRTGVSSLRRLRRQPRDRQTDRRDVQAHYDLGNEFFELMLDSTMMYSSAVFESEGLTLLEGSMAKLERICQRLELGPDDHVIEIGTGWGGFAIYAASRFGCQVTTTTISDAQYRLAAKRVADAGLSGLIEVRNDDYRDLTGTYDKLVSIEMIEAIGWRQSAKRRSSNATSAMSR